MNKSEIHQAQAPVKKENRGRTFGGVTWTRDRETERVVGPDGKVIAIIDSYSFTTQAGHVAVVYLRYERGPGMRVLIGGANIGEVRFTGMSHWKKDLDEAFTVAKRFPSYKGTQIDSDTRRKIGLK